MISAAITAFADLTAPGFRAIVLKAIGLTIALFIGGVVAVEYALSYLLVLKWSWLETVAQWGAGLALIAGLFFLIVPVTAIFAGLYFDRVADLTEQRHYPQDRPGQAPGSLAGFLTGLQFAGLALLISLLVFPFIFFGIGIIVLPLANAYVISREYFVMAAARHTGLEQAKALRRAHALKVWAAGLAPALFGLVPLANLAMPVFAASYFVHIAKAITGSSGDSGRDRR